MVYAAILAGGSGSRMDSSLPKQYLKIKEKPILFYSVEAFAANNRIDGILVAVSRDYYEYAGKLISEYCPQTPVTLVAGGEDRLSTLKNILNHLKQNNMLGGDTILLTHDAVRPFIDQRIINDNIDAAIKYGACNTVIPTVDTILLSEDGEFISSVLPRKSLYNVQTPQTFNAQKLYELVFSLSEEERASLTDACSVFIMRGERVRLVEGRPENIKITYPSDILLAEKLTVNS